MDTAPTAGATSAIDQPTTHRPTKKSTSSSWTGKHTARKQSPATCRTVRISHAHGKNLYDHSKRNQTRCSRRRSRRWALRCGRFVRRGLRYSSAGSPDPNQPQSQPMRNLQSASRKHGRAIPPLAALALVRRVFAEHPKSDALGR